MDLIFDMPSGMPVGASFQQNRELWGRFLNKYGIKLLDKKGKELRGKVPHPTTQENIFMKGLSRKDKTIYKAFLAFSQQEIRTSIRSEISLPSDKDMLIEYVLMDHFAKENNIFLDLSDITEDEAAEIKSVFPIYEAITKISDSSDILKKEALPFSRWLLQAFNLSDKEDVDKSSIVTAFFAASSWFNTPLPLMALVEKDESYLELVKGLLINGSDEISLPRAEFSLFSPDIYMKSELLAMQLALSEWKESIEEISMDDISNGLSRIQEMGEQARLMSTDMADINKTVISRSIEKLFNDSRKLNNIISNKELSVNYLSDVNISRAKKQWDTIKEACFTSEEQSRVINALNEKLTEVKEIINTSNYILSRIDKLKNDANETIKNSDSLFSNMEKLNALHKEHQDQHEDLRDMIQHASEIIFPDSEISCFIERIEEDTFEVGPDELELAKKKIHSLYTQIEMERERYAILESESKEYRDEIHNQKSKINAINDQKNKLLDRVQNHQDKVLTNEDRESLHRLMLDQDLATPKDALVVARMLYPGKVIILPEAWKSAEEAESFKYAPRLLALINTLLGDYLDALTAGQPDTEARQLFGKSYSAKESETVTKNPALRRHREFKVNNEIVFMNQHLIIGKAISIQETLRLHFKVINNKVYIGHCGEHLPLPNAS